jgi:hypothetical protein
MAFTAQAVNSPSSTQATVARKLILSGNVRVFFMVNARFWNNPQVD